MIRTMVRSCKSPAFRSSVVRRFGLQSEGSLEQVAPALSDQSLPSIYEMKNAVYLKGAEKYVRINIYTTYVCMGGYLYFFGASSPLTSTCFVLVFGYLLNMVDDGLHHIGNSYATKISLSSCKNKAVIEYDVNNPRSTTVAVRDLSLVLGDEAEVRTKDLHCVKLRFVDSKGVVGFCTVLLPQSKREVFDMSIPDDHLLQDVLNGRHEKVKEYEYVGK